MIEKKKPASAPVVPSWDPFHELRARLHGGVAIEALLPASLFQDAGKASAQALKPAG